MTLDAFSLLVGSVRGLHVAATLSLFGALLFPVIVLPAAGRAELRDALGRLVLASGAVALVAGMCWLALQSSSIADTAGWREGLSTIVPVARATRFGHAMLLRFALLLAAMLMRRWPVLALPASGGAVILQSWVGHAVAMPDLAGDELMSSEALHLLAAGAWVGALAPLVIALRSLPPALAAQTARRFSPFGLACVLVLAGTATLQGSVLIGGVPGLLGTRYGQLALLKLAGFVLLLVLAGFNRLVWAPAGDVRRLRVSVAIEILLGLVVVLCAAMMATQPPGVHEQPVWPFAWRPSLLALEDPDLRAEVARALLMLGGAVAAALVALVVRRTRWAALGAAALLVWFAVPHLDLLFVEAYPTSFFMSPNGFAAISIVEGARLYAANCASCHGAHGAGDGPSGDAAMPPADLLAGHVWEHSDGEMFWWLSHGIEAPDGGMAMPGFASVLEPGQLWALIDFVRGNNAGMMLARGTSPHPVRAPDIEITCRDGREMTLDRMRGQPLRIVAGPPPVAVEGLATIAMVRDGEDATSASCVATDPAAWTAYAIVLGLAPDTLNGSQFLIDPEGWLRAVWRPGDPPAWTRPEELPQAVAAICSQPIADDAGESDAHHH